MCAFAVLDGLSLCVVRPPWISFFVSVLNEFLFWNGYFEMIKTLFIHKVTMSLILGEFWNSAFPPLSPHWFYYVSLLEWSRKEERDWILIQFQISNASLRRQKYLGREGIIEINSYKRNEWIFTWYFLK